MWRSKLFILQFVGKNILAILFQEFMFYSKAFEIRNIITNTAQETLVREEYHLNISHTGNIVPQKIMTQKKFVLLK